MCAYARLALPTCAFVCAPALPERGFRLLSLNLVVLTVPMSKYAGWIGSTICSEVLAEHVFEVLRVVIKADCPHVLRYGEQVGSGRVEV